MENKSSKGVSCKLSLPRYKSLIMLSVYTKGYPRSSRDKFQSDKKESMHGIVWYDVICDVLNEFSYKTYRYAYEFKWYRTYVYGYG
jgi:hypothetical protein